MKWLKRIAEWWGKFMCVIALHKDVFTREPDKWQIDELDMWGYAAHDDGGLAYRRDCTLVQTPI